MRAMRPFICQLRAATRLPAFHFRLEGSSFPVDVVGRRPRQIEMCSALASDCATDLPVVTCDSPRFVVTGYKVAVLAVV